MHKIVKNTKSLSFGVVYYMVMANGQTVFSGSSNSGTKFPQVKVSIFFWTGSSARMFSLVIC